MIQGWPTNVVQFSSVAQSCLTLWDPWTAARQASLSITNSRSSLRLTSIESVVPSSRLILWHPLLLLPPTPPRIRVFSNESNLRTKWPKYWSCSFSISPSKQHPGLISFKMDWLDLLAGQGTLKNLLQNHSSKASILRRSKNQDAVDWWWNRHKDQQERTENPNINLYRTDNGFLRKKQKQFNGGRMDSLSNKRRWSCGYPRARKWNSRYTS